MLRGLEHLTCEERLRELACSVWRRVGFGEISRQPYQTYKETTKRTDQLFTVVHGRRMSNNGYERFRLQVRKTVSL